MVEEKIRGWTFHVDSLDGVPYFQCPYCSRKVGGKKIVFATMDLTSCPDCGKELHFGNIRGENWSYIDSFYGDDE